MDRTSAIIVRASGANTVVEAHQVLSFDARQLPCRSGPGEPSRLEARPARRCFEKALSIQPGNREAAANLRALREKTQPPRAR